MSGVQAGWLDSGVLRLRPRFFRGLWTPRCVEEEERLSRHRPVGEVRGLHLPCQEELEEVEEFPLLVALGPLSLQPGCLHYDGFPYVRVGGRESGSEYESGSLLAGERRGVYSGRSGPPSSRSRPITRKASAYTAPVTRSLCALVSGGGETSTRASVHRSC